MYNRPSSKPRFQQEPTIDSINRKEKQLYLQSSSINPLTGAVLRSDQQNNQQQNNKQIALQASSINPLTGAPVVRNIINYQSEPIQQKNTPYGVEQNANSYTTSSGQIGSGSNTDVQFQKNLVKFFAADDPSQPHRKNNFRQSNSKSNNSFSQQVNPLYQEQQPKIKNNDNPTLQNSQISLYKFYSPNQSIQTLVNNDATPDPRLVNDPNFQKNLNKFFAADDPTFQDSQISLYKFYSPSQSIQTLVNNDVTPDPRLVNDPKFQKNLNKFFATDDPSQQQQQINVIQQNKLKRLEQDPRFQKNLQQFFGIDDKNSQQKQQQSIQETIQQNINKSSKVIAITDSSSIARNHVASFFRARGVDDFDVFTNPGGVFGLQNNPVQEQSLKYYLDTMNNAYVIKEVYIISVLDNNSNVKLFTSLNDKRSNQIAIQELKSVLENKFNVQQKLHGIIIDQRGASEKAF